MKLAQKKNSWIRFRQSGLRVIHVGILLLVAFVYSNLQQCASYTDGRAGWGTESSERTDTNDVERGDIDLLAVNDACPAERPINEANDHKPYPELLGMEEIRSVLNYWHGFNCQDEGSIEGGFCNFKSLGQHLLHHAILRNQTLLTVQLGAMDGQKNDPMYEMFVPSFDEGNQYVRGRASFNDLRNWLPVMIEPVPRNYKVLLETYTKIAETKGLACAVPINAAVSYDDPSKTTCPFCRTNTAEDAPKECKTFPAWKMHQLGTLDCDNSRLLFGNTFELCIIQDPLPCSSITNLLSERSIPSRNIGMLQIDIEGYEVFVLKGMMNEVPDAELPLIIHFENKVMKNYNYKAHRMAETVELLTSKGYILYDEKADTLAVRVGKTVA